MWFWIDTDDGSVISGVRIPLFRFRCWEHAYPLYEEIAPRSHDLKHGDIHLWLKALNFGVRHRLVGNGTSLYEGCWAYKIDLVSKFGHPQEVVQSEQTCKAESWWQEARQRLKQLRLWFTHEKSSVVQMKTFCRSHVCWGLQSPSTIGADFRLAEKIV